MNGFCRSMVILGVGMAAGRSIAVGQECAVLNGDTNGDGGRDISDAVYSLNFQFIGGPAIATLCEPPGQAREGCAVENGDTNGDKKTDLSDAVYILSFQFLGGPAPVPICSVESEVVCDNAMDDDDDGATDCDDPDCATAASCLMEDRDGDGFSIGEGDCDDANASVNPGAYDFAGNEIDDDCDGTIDPPRLVCDVGLASNSSDPMDYALAMDLCQTTSESPPAGERKWGVISAELTLLNGEGAPNEAAHAIRTGFGSGNPPPFGHSMAILSTGHAAAPGQTNPPYAAFQGGQDLGTTSDLPADWLLANGGTPPNAPGCPAPIAPIAGHDPVMLTLRIRVPTNARSFRFSAKFLSAEYPEFVCSEYNDFFVALLNSTYSGAPANPNDKNLAIVMTSAGAIVPVGINLALASNGLLQDCLNGPTGCAGDVEGSYSGCTGTLGLAGTGMDVANPPAQVAGFPGWCGASNLTGGGTAWLGIEGNVEPGEIIDLRLALWDTGDGWYDSVVLLDNFEWSATTIEPGATAE